VDVREVKWDKRGLEQAGDCNFFYGKGNKNHQMETKFFVRIISAFKRVEFVRDMMLHIVLRGHRCNIIVLNLHAATEEENYD
jgi:hypothetical protein